MCIAELASPNTHRGLGLRNHDEESKKHHYGDMTGKPNVGHISKRSVSLGPSSLSALPETETISQVSLNKTLVTCLGKRLDLSQPDSSGEL